MVILQVVVDLKFFIYNDFMEKIVNLVMLVIRLILIMIIEKIFRDSLLRFCVLFNFCNVDYGEFIYKLQLKVGFLFFYLRKFYFLNIKEYLNYFKYFKRVFGIEFFILRVYSCCYLQV